MESKLSSSLLRLRLVLTPTAADASTMELDICLELEARLAWQLFPVESWLELECLLAHVDKCADLVCVTLDPSQVNEPLVGDILLSTSAWSTCARPHLLLELHSILRRPRADSRTAIEKLTQLFVHRHRDLRHAAVVLCSELKLYLSDLVVKVAHFQLVQSFLLEYLVL